ncbi:MAG: HAD family hydrolase [Hyphomicrobium sp.]|nr:HAD family hydrolase [Hyphomicrobium sp.]PPC83960.1 MAG: HAD family hydrolase [Hyphomicrobium sp.]
MKLVIFDCDGTIVDSQNGIYEAMVHAYGVLGIEPPKRFETIAIIGLSLPEAFAVLASSESDATRRELARHYKNAFMDMKRDPAHHEPLFPGAAHVIESLAAREDIRLGIATGKSQRGVVRLFDREGWHPHFVTVQTADDHPSKPHPSMILAAMADAGVGPSRTVMIGDTTYDIEMARAAGVGAVGVTWGYHAPPLLDGAGAHVLVDEYSQLPAVIDRLIEELEAAA